MIRSKTAMGFVWAFMALILHVVPIVPSAHAQGTRKDDIVFNSRGIPLAGASVRVCASPASGQPCTPLAQIFSDPGLTQALANPTTTDGLGNYFFYASPGKYMIEISGPGIPTKQIPDVIVPLDPSAPTFSGAISAFSLNLSGNLSVTGNTSIIGNLASGTLNLSNQATPPGSASPGTVNLYAKTLDKRLYYKDETGTEIGPLATGSGAQLNVANTFTAPQSIAADFHTKGPNPNYDVSLFGAYASSFNAYNNGVPTPNTTGTIAAGSSTLTLAAAQDFQNGQGVVVTHAGGTTSLPTPGAPSVTPFGIVTGTTTYNYQVACEDTQEGITAASPSGTTTSGVATLGANSATVVSVSRTAGVTTYTTSAPHNFQPNTIVNMPNAGNSEFDGTLFITSVPTSTTFTVDQSGKVDVATTSFSATATVMAGNLVKLWYPAIGGSTTPMRCLIYRSTGAGPFSLVGVSMGMDPYFEDLGFGLDANVGNNIPAFPYYWPTTPPATPLPQSLDTTIVAGGGTTTLTLANAASTAASVQIVIHDNTPSFLAAQNAAQNGGTVYVPAPGTYQINFPLSLPLLPSFAMMRFLMQGPVHANQPILTHSNYVFEGEPFISPAQFGFGKYAQVSGTSLPAFLVPAIGAQVNITWENLELGNNKKQNVGLFVDGGPGAVGLVFDHVAFLGTNSSPGYYDKGGAFDRIFNGGVCSGGSTFSIPCMRFSNSTTAMSSQQIVGNVRINEVNFNGSGIQVDNFPDPAAGNGTSFHVQEALYESGFQPWFSMFVGSQPWSEITFARLGQSDLAACCGTPVVQFGNSSLIFGVTWSDGSITNSNEPLISGGAGPFNSPVFINAPFVKALGPQSFITPTGITNNQFTLTNSSIVVPMSAPTGVPTCNVVAGGGVPAGNHAEQIAWVDPLGRETSLSASCSATTTAGNQTIQVTAPTTVSTGAVGFTVYRDGIKTGVGSGSCPANAIGSTFSDTLGFGNPCGTGNPLNPGAALSQMDSSTILAPKITLGGGRSSSSLTGSFTASRFVTQPDVSGFNEVSGYLNSAYDNAGRANGAIGANWTLQQNGFNIASNQIIGTTAGGSNSAFWNANPFASNQFSQVTVTGLNGTSDFPGVTVAASGSGSTSTYYDCVENSTTIFLQRIVNAGTTNLTNVASAGAPGDVLRLELGPGGALTCFKNGVATLTQTDSTITSGSPGLLISGGVATVDNWSGGNLHPFSHMDVEQDWTKTQHFTQGLALSGESLSASPRSLQSVFLPGALTSTWTGLTWTPDKAIVVTRVQVQAKTAPSGCTTNASVRLTDGTSPVNLAIAAATNDSGPIAQSYAAGASLTISVQTAAIGCTTSPADANVVVQYRMQ